MIVRALPDYREEAYLYATQSHEIKNERQLTFFNSGSAALRCFLSIFGAGKRVGVQSFTCSTVKQAIEAENDIPILMDADVSFLSTSVEEVTKCLDKIDILILTHLGGVPNPYYREIKNMCMEHNIIMIDDLCQTYFAKVDGKYIEDMSSNYFYSFFYDKPISACRGGALKVEDKYNRILEQKIKDLPHESNHIGRKRLHRAKWVNRLLQPENYNYEFRTFQKWEILLLSYCPFWVSNKLVLSMLRRKLSKLLSHIVPNIESEDVAVMSDVQIKYIEYLMRQYTSNNEILYEFLKHYGIDKKLTYLRFSNIECSIAKRAYVPVFDNRSLGDVEIALYNWPTLLDESKNNNLLDIWVNIPTYAVWFK